MTGECGHPVKKKWMLQTRSLTACPSQTQAPSGWITGAHVFQNGKGFGALAVWLQRHLLRAAPRKKLQGSVLAVSPATSTLHAMPRPRRGTYAVEVVARVLAVEVAGTVGDVACGSELGVLSEESCAAHNGGGGVQVSSQVWNNAHPRAAVDRQTAEKSSQCPHPPKSWLQDPAQSRPPPPQTRQMSSDHYQTLLNRNRSATRFSFTLFWILGCSGRLRKIRSKRCCIDGS